MAPCSIINCANTTKKVEGVNENISFHRFPKDPLVKNKWIEATGRKNWFPTKHSRICSIHFHEDSFTGSSKFRRIIHTAYPTIDVVIMSNNEKDGNSTNAEEENNNGQSHKRKNKRPLTPREKRLYDLVKHQRLVIKRFREQNRRKAKRIEDLETIINYLEGQIKDQNLLPD